MGLAEEHSRLHKKASFNGKVMGYIQENSVLDPGITYLIS